MADAGEGFVGEILLLLSSLKHGGQLKQSTMAEHMQGRGIKDLLEEERPRERLLKLGPQALTIPELIALLLGSGTLTKSAIELGAELYRDVAEGSLNKMARFDAKRYQTLNGIGPAKAITLIAAFELSRRRESEVNSWDVITGSEDAYRKLRGHLADLPHEEVWALFLTQSSRLLAKEQISVGTTQQVLFDVAELSRRALEHRAKSVIVAHNHPGGSSRPSSEDIAITRQLQEALALFNIRLLDHLVLTQSEYASLRALGHFA